MAKSIAYSEGMPLIARILNTARYTVLEAWRNHVALLMADLGKHEAAKILLGGLLAGGTLADTHEQLFLLE